MPNMYDRWKHTRVVNIDPCAVACIGRVVIFESEVVCIDRAQSLVVFGCNSIYSLVCLTIVCLEIYLRRSQANNKTDQFNYQVAHGCLGVWKKDHDSSKIGEISARIDGKGITHICKAEYCFWHWPWHGIVYLSGNATKATPTYPWGGMGDTIAIRACVVRGLLPLIVLFVLLAC